MIRLMHTVTDPLDRVRELFEEFSREKFVVRETEIVVARVPRRMLTDDLGLSRKSVGAVMGAYILIDGRLPAWKTRYIAWHEHVHRTLPWRTQDPHTLALESELELAKAELGPKFDTYLRWRKRVEESRYFSTERGREFLRTLCHNENNK